MNQTSEQTRFTDIKHSNDVSKNSMFTDMNRSDGKTVFEGATPDDLRRVFNTRSKVLSEEQKSHLIDFLTVKNKLGFDKSKCEVIDFDSEPKNLDSQICESLCAYHIKHLDLIYWYPRWMHEILMLKQGKIQTSKESTNPKCGMGSGDGNHIYTHAFVYYLHQLNLSVEQQDQVYKERIETDSFKQLFKDKYGADYDNTITLKIKTLFAEMLTLTHEHSDFKKGAKVLGRYVHAMYTGCSFKNKYQIDHINRDTFDMRPCNLRLVTLADNHKNKVRSESLFTKIVLKNMIWVQGKPCETKDVIIVNPEGLPCDICLSDLSKDELIKLVSRLVTSVDSPSQSVDVSKSIDTDSTDSTD